MDKITTKSVDFLSDDITLAADSSTLVSTQHATKQFVTNSIASAGGFRTFATVSVAETSTGTANNICYVVENDTFYRYTSTGSAYTDDNKWILSTGDGGGTRWIGVAGKYNYTTTNVFEGTGALDIINSGTDNIAIGYRASHLTSTGNYSIAIGTDALYSATVGNAVAIGYKAAEVSTTAGALVYIGYTAGRYATGASNLYIGERAGRGVSGQSTGTANIGIGATALYVYTTGHDNTAIGLQSLQSLTTGNYNTAIGANAGYSITTTSGNMILGTYAGQYVNGNYNVYVGYTTGFGSSGSSTGAGNIGIGYNTAASNTTGAYNIYIGYQAALALQTCSDTIAIGRYAGGKSVGSDTGNIFIGYSCGAGCVGNSSNVLIGYNALSNGTTNNTVAIGYEAFLGYQGVSEVTNITVNSATIANYVGDYYRFYSNFGGSYTFDFWFDTTGSDSQPAGANGTVQTKITITGLTTVNQIATAIATAMNAVLYRGLQIFSSSSTTSPAIITVVNKGSAPDPVMTNASELSATVTTQGVDPASGALNVYVGASAGYSTRAGGNNVYIGYRAGYSGTSAGTNVAIGANAGYTSTTLSGYVFVGYQAGQYATGASTTCVGYQAGMGASGQSSGQSNTFIGYSSGQAFTSGANNTCVGTNSGLSITTGQSNVLIGIQTGSYCATGSYNTVLGSYANAGYQYLATTVANNVMIGYNTGYYSATITSSVFIGSEAGYNTLEANYNILIGRYAGRNVTATSNVAIGYQTYGGVVTTAAHEYTRVSCVADVSGSLAGKYFSFSSTATTYWLWYQVSGSGSAPTPTGGETLVQCNLITNDTATSVATKTISSIQGIAGTPVLTFTLNSSIYVYIANKLAGNVTDAANGAGGLSPAFTFNITTQGSGTSTTATNGVAVGTQALTALTSGSYNTALGYRSGYTLTTGTKNIFIGHTADTTSTGLVNSIVIGYEATTATSNQIVIGNTSTGSAIVKGIYGNTNGTNSYVRVGSDGTLYQDNNLLSIGYLYGLTTSNDSDAAHDIAIAAGGCRDSSNTVNIILSSPTVKQIDASWAAGSGAGGLFSGTVGNNTWYYVFVIRKDSDGSIDAGFDTSITAANKPAGYTYYRRVGAILTDGSANIIKFSQQNGNEFIWDVIVQSAYTNNPGISRILVTMAAPPSSIVITNGEVYCPAAAGVALLLTSPSATDSTPSVNLFDAYTYYGGTTVIKNIKADSSSRVGYRVDASSTNVTVMIHTVGWIDEF